RVEIFHNNIWGTVSDSNWNLNDAEVVCRQLNCGSALEATQSAYFGPGTGQVWLTGVTCSGNESSLSECQHSGWGNYYYYYYNNNYYYYYNNGHYSDAGVICSGPIRLTGSGSTGCAGRLEVYHNNSWGTVCDDGWDLNDAEVVCRQLNCGSALEVPPSAHFGAGTGQIWLDNVTCSGNESSLAECQHSGFGSNTCEHGQDAAVICSAVSIILTGSGSTRCSGRVEVYHSNSWGTVCDDGWDLNDAEVVCRQLNCGSALEVPQSDHFGAGTGQIWLDHVTCSGNESTLTECQHSGFGSNTCEHGQDAAVICSDLIRLVGSGSSRCSGRVEIFHNNIWGTVSDSNWNLNDAEVVCRQLNCGSALEATQSSKFGAGTGQVWLTGVTCSGNESSLSECQHPGWGNYYNYYNNYYYYYYYGHYYDVGVICSGDIRLVGSGSTRCSGRVEVYHSNSWGTVCDDGWDLNDAEVVCRQLNCGSALEVPQSAHFGAGTGQIWLDRVTCSGNESSLTDCQHSGFQSNRCEHGQDAAVVCSDLIRLAGAGSSRCSGRVEIFHNNIWGTVFDFNWDLNDAEVVCRQLNCGSALQAPQSAYFGPGTGQIWLGDVTCSGNESSLSECQHSGWGNYYYYYYNNNYYYYYNDGHYSDAGVICSGLIRLTGSGSSGCAGRVEVYHNNSWGTVCDDGWDLSDAEVVCRQLNCGSALEVPALAHFGAGTGQIWLDNVTCSGNESSLTECQHSGFGSNTCEHGQDAAVICSEPVEFNIDLNLLFPISSLPPNFIDLFRDYVGNLTFPQTISWSLILEELNFTTWCYPNSTGGLQCQCEDQFAWSCDKCGVYGACSNVTSQTCECIKELPSTGEFCEPITNISSCPTTTPEITPSPTPTYKPVEFNIDLNLLFPISSLPPNFIDLFRDYVGNLTFPQTISWSLILEELNFTTWCYPNSTGGLQCQCEDQFAWSCDKCGVYGACSNVTSQTCECIKGLPSTGEFCEPITNVSSCPTTTPEITPSPTPTYNTSLSPT
uniref:SRCR domain-containing protein n=1 Tax=Oreochromis aureus TaxID=47969 RepID=A0AAZ1X4K7_OREAU